MHKDIIVVGDGWGAVALYKGLSRKISPLYVFTTDNYIKTLVSNKNLIIDCIDGLKDKVLIFSGYTNLVSDEIIDFNTCINIHYSLLPKYRGLHSIVWAILNDEDELGLSIHLMNKNIDDGDIIHQVSFANDRVSTSTQFIERDNEYVEKHIYEILYSFLEGKTKLKLNDKSQATWVGRRNLKDCQIDFNRTLNYQKCFFRALVRPYPLPYVLFKGRKFEITKAGFHEQNVDTHIGRILNIDSEGLWVKVSDGFLILKEIEEEGHIVDIKETFKIGQRFDDYND